jgi:hypothetical protein
VNKCNFLFAANYTIKARLYFRSFEKNDCYDLRDDKKLNDGDIVGFCRLCGRPVSVDDVKCVNAITFTCVKLGPNANGILSISQEYECFGGGCKRVQGPHKAR